MYVVGSVVVPVTEPAQLSVADGAVTVTEHSPVASAIVGAVGTVLSTTFTLAVPEATLPCISVTVSVTVLTELIECVPSPEILF